MTALAGIRDILELVLADAGNAIYSTAELDAALRSALHEYSQSWPNHNVATVELEKDGREIEMGITGLLAVVNVWWPYDDTADVWPPNRVRAWRQMDLAGEPTLYFDSINGAEPLEDEVVRVWYTALHTIDDLDSADTTTVRPDHENVIIQGAAGKAAMTRAVELAETADIDIYIVESLRAWARLKLREFFVALQQLRAESVRQGLPYTDGWAVDKWDVRT